MNEHAEVLAGGNASGPVVRIGATVRKPWTAATAGVVEFMLSVRGAGVDVPAALGRDGAGRQILEYVPGRLAQDLQPLSLVDLSRVGRLVRSIHDASEGFQPSFEAAWESAIPAPGGELICHNDLAPWNLIMGDRWVFIDWDAAAPSTRIWDLAYAAQGFTLQDTTAAPDHAAHRLRAFIDGYDADAFIRQALPQAMVHRAAAMHDLLQSSHESGTEPWASMYSSGHGAHWSDVAAYTAKNQATWTRALSFNTSTR